MLKFYLITLNKFCEVPNLVSFSSPFIYTVIASGNTIVDLYLLY